MGVDYFTCDICDNVTNDCVSADVTLNDGEDLSICLSCWRKESKYFVILEHDDDEKCIVMAKSGYTFWVNTPTEIISLEKMEEEKAHDLYGYIDTQNVASRGYASFTECLRAAAAQYEKEADHDIYEEFEKVYKRTPELVSVMKRNIDAQMEYLKAKRQKLE